MSVGLGSLEELCLLYLFSGFIILLLWGWLEARVLLGDVEGQPEREAARRRLTRPLALLGVLHVGFAIIALHAARSGEEADAVEVTTSAPRSAGAEASAAVVAGVAALALAASGVA